MKTKTQFTRQILSIVLCLAMLAACIPSFSLTVFAQNAVTPTARGGGVFFANGTDLFVDAGTSGGTAVYYYNGDAKVYLNTNGEAGDDDGTVMIYAGASLRAITADVTITVLGGNVSRIFCAGSYAEGDIIGNVTVKLLGGTVETVWGRGDVDTATVSGITTLIALGGNVTNAWVMSGTLYKSGTEWTASGAPVIPADMTIEVSEGETFTVSSGANLTNNGTFVNKGTLALYGSVTGNDVTGSGTINCYTSYIENISSVSAISAKIDGNTVALKNGQYRLSDGKLYIWLPEGNAEVTLNSAKYYGVTVHGEKIKLTNDYVPVNDILNIPSEITAYVSVSLRPTTNTTTLIPTFSYEILSDGTTASDVKLTGSTLNASGEGTVRLKVTADDGYFPYSETFDIAVKNSGYAASIANGNITFSEYSDTQIKVTHADFEDGYLIIGKDDYFTVTGKSDNAYVITIDNCAVNLIFEDVSISTNKFNVSPLRINSGSSVNLVLTGSSTLSNSNDVSGTGASNAGIHLPSDASLVIDGPGSLSVSGGTSAAGIGTGYDAAGGTLTINGGTINATGQQEAIGGRIITINGGTVIAQGGKYGAGVGGGDYNSGGIITINGGTVNAEGGKYGAAGIGGNQEGSAGEITINGGTITSKGYWSAGIGCGDYASGGTVTINGGTITATQSDGPGDIGGDDSTVVITGGNVNAASVAGTCKDGNGNDLSLNAITLNGAAEQIAIRAIEGAAGYGLSDVTTLAGGKLGLYLPSGETPTSVTLENGDTYYGEMKESSATFYKIDMSKKPDTDEDGFYLIADIDDLIWFSQYALVDSTINGRVTADIDTSGSGFTTIGIADAPYSGTFDGGGHSITVDINATENCAALFDYVNGAAIQNLTVDGKITTSAKFGSGLIGNSVGATTIDNVKSKVVIESSVNGDGTHGGLVAVASETLTIKNSGFEGAINGASTTSCGGFVGWANGGTALTIENCYLSASFGVKADGGHTIARNYANATVSIKAFYYLNELNETPVSDEIIQKSAEQFASGEVAALLSGSGSGTATMFGGNGGTGMLFTGVLIGLVLGILGTLLVQRARRNSKE